MGNQYPLAMILARLALAIGVLFLPAFFMGGTLPVLLKRFATGWS